MNKSQCKWKQDWRKISVSGSGIAVWSQPLFHVRQPEMVESMAKSSAAETSAAEVSSATIPLRETIQILLTLDLPLFSSIRLLIYTIGLILILRIIVKVV